jgi:hypothetical protein
MIVLRYAGKDMETYRGLVFREAYGDHNPLDTFDGLTFDDMLGLLSRILTEYPGEPECALERTDIPGGLPIVLDEGSTTLLRANPQRMINQLGYRHDSQVARTPHRKTPGPALVGGIESVRNVVGHIVYVRCDGNDRYECPACGRWADMVADAATHTHAHVACSVQVTEMARLPGYLGISTVRLLAQKVDRLWLPQMWTKGCSWIPREQLEERFNNFLNNKPKE